MTVSLLFITPAPDERESTANLARLVEEANRRSGCTAELWYLRCAPEHQQMPNSRNVDGLRTWLPVRLLERLGLGRSAAALRGVRLRWWLHRARPDVVVLDDGLGRRVVEQWRPPPAIVVRRNRTPPEHLHMESRPEGDPDLWMVPAGDERPSGSAPVLTEHPFVDSPARRNRNPLVRRQVRQRLDLPVDECLVVGWGRDGWLDGPDLFVRALWALEHRHGLLAHGVWFGLAIDEQDGARIRGEAERCGLQHRFHLRDDQHPDDRLCGDGVLLPYRSTADPTEVLDAAFCGAVTVTFTAAQVAHPLVVQVRDLDVDAAAGALVAGLQVEAEVRSDTARHYFDPSPVVTELVALAVQR